MGHLRRKTLDYCLVLRLHVRPLFLAAFSLFAAVVGQRGEFARLLVVVGLSNGAGGYYVRLSRTKLHRMDTVARV
jgi:hypothetical protein